MNVSCQCGAVAFKTPLPKPLAVYICHCDECRRQSSSAFGCSAIFPKFDLPSKKLLSCYSRPTASGHTLNCYFCKNCGTRVIHSTPGKNVVSVKGGCIEGLDFKSARHIWCKRAMVPIPEGVERDEEEPKENTLSDDLTKDVAFMSGSGGSASDEEKKKSRLRFGKGKKRDSDVTGKLSLEKTEVNGRNLINRDSLTTNGSSPTGSNTSSVLMAERERQKGKRRIRDKNQDSAKVKEWDQGVEAELDKIQGLPQSTTNEIDLGLETPGNDTEKQVVEGDGHSLHH